MVPEHPAGIVELSDAELGDVSGGANHWDSIFGYFFGTQVRPRRDSSRTASSFQRPRVPSAPTRKPNDDSPLGDHVGIGVEAGVATSSPTPSQQDSRLSCDGDRYGDE